MTRLDPALLLSAYAAGIFPMAESRDANELFWVEPESRAVIPLDRFRLSRSLRKTIRADRFAVTCDTEFAQVVRACADRDETWINPAIERGYARLHEAGHAHSIECWQRGALVGGLYGVRLGGAFFGESMFSTERDASKIALAWLVARLRVGGFVLLDCQFMTPHLASLGAIEMSKQDYVALLGAAVGGGAAGSGAGVAGVAGVAGFAGRALATGAARPDFALLDSLLASGPASVAVPAPGCVIAQLLGQAS